MTSPLPICDQTIDRSGGLQASVRLKRLPVCINAEKEEKLLRVTRLQVAILYSLLHSESLEARFVFVFITSEQAEDLSWRPGVPPDWPGETPVLH